MPPRPRPPRLPDWHGEPIPDPTTKTHCSCGKVKYPRSWEDPKVYVLVCAWCDLAGVMPVAPS